MDDDCFFTIVGRKKELIIASNFNVYPVEIEDALDEQHDVLEVAVVGVKDKYRGESIKAYVVWQGENHSDKNKLIEYCQTELGAYKISKTIEFMIALQNCHKQGVKQKVK